MARSRRVEKTEPRELERAASRLRAFLAGGPRRQAEIVEALGAGVWRPGIATWLDLVRAARRYVAAPARRPLRPGRGLGRP